VSEKTFAVIGFGNAGEQLTDVLQSLGWRLVDVADSDLKKRLLLSQFKRDIGVYHDYREMVQKTLASLVIVSTYDNQHVDPAGFSLNAGKRVFIEKPLVTSSLQLKMMKNLADSFPNMILFDEKFRYSDLCVTARALRQRLGDFVGGQTCFLTNEAQGQQDFLGRDTWRGKLAYNPVAGGLSHNFQMLYEFTGPAVSVTARGKVVSHTHLEERKGYDFMEGCVDFKNNASLQFEVNMSYTGVPPYLHRRVVHPKLFFQGGFLHQCPDPQKDVINVAGENVRFQREPITAVDWPQYSRQLYRRMFEHLFAEGPPDLSAAFNVTALCIAAFKSAQAGGEPVEIANVYT